MVLLRKRKVIADEDTIGAASRMHKRSKVAHSITTSKTVMKRLEPAVQLPIHDVDKENVSMKQKRKRGDEEPAVMQSKRACEKSLKQKDITPQKSRSSTILPPSPCETPGRRTARLFDRLGLQNKTPSSSNAGNDYDTPPTSPGGDLIFADTLPLALTDLVAIYAAFLSALNEQMATNALYFRIQLEDLMSSMTSVWKQRSVTIDDVRRVLGMSSAEWMLEDFGKAGVSLTRESASNGMSSVVDMHKKKRAFATQLRRHWNQWSQTSESQDPTMFLDQLPLAPVSTSDTIDGATAYRARGQDRLASLKASQSAARTNLVQNSALAPASVDANARGSNLLERVLAKQAAISSLPAGPTKAQLERKAILQRVEEVARILDVLSAGRMRASFSMQSVTQQIQQSIRNPMSSVEVVKCLTMIATEIMPQFVSIVSSGNVIGVVITRAGKLGFADLKKVIADIDV